MVNRMGCVVGGMERPVVDFCRSSGHLHGIGRVLRLSRRAGLFQAVVMGPIVFCIIVIVGGPASAAYFGGSEAFWWFCGGTVFGWFTYQLGAELGP